MRQINYKIISACFLFLCVGWTLQSCSQRSTNLESPKEKESDDKSSQASEAITVPVVRADLFKLKNDITLPGELQAYQDVPVHAKVEGFISWIGVDRASKVRKGQKLIVISCPELDEKLKEAAAKVSSAEASFRQSQSALLSEISKKVEAKAKYDADELTYRRIREASKTPGAIAQNDVDASEKTVEGDQARLDSSTSLISAAKAVVESERANVIAAKNVLDSMGVMRSYLTVLAPFDGVITERNVHNGSIVAVDASRSALPLVRIQETSLLRLVVAVPEDAVGTLHEGNVIFFAVPAYPGKRFSGTVARPAYALDTATRTMPVELNVPNQNGELAPGMFATVDWTVSRPYKTVFLPSSAVGTDLKGSFVIKVNNGISERVSVKKGDPMGDLTEVIGDLKAGDMVALKGTDELKDGTRLSTRLSSDDEVKKINRKADKSGGE